MDSPTGQDWTTVMLPEWEKELIPRFRGKENLWILEIGCFEGRSGAWLIENLCTRPGCTYIGIDPFTGSKEHEGLDLSRLKQTCARNLLNAKEATPFGCRVEILQRFSRDVLEYLPARHYDLIYIDGSHEYKDVLYDLRESLRLAAPGGLIMVDDCDWPGVYKAVSELFGPVDMQGKRQLFIPVPRVVR